MRCTLVGKTDVGRQRMRNEDNFLLLENYYLSVVADGMGGHIDGNIASQIAVDTLEDTYQNKYPPMLASTNSTSLEELKKAQEMFMIESVQQANRNIFARNKGNLTLEGMGTTIVALQIGDGYAITACVGDSRIYLFRDNKLVQITQDHSLVGELVRYNIIDKQDIMFLQNKNIITRALGMSENVMVDTTIQKILPDDVFLLCSDGLSDLAPDERIEKILAEEIEDLDSTVETLINEANDCGGQDNITVSLVKIL